MGVGLWTRGEAMADFLRRLLLKIGARLRHHPPPAPIPPEPTPMTGRIMLGGMRRMVEIEYKQYVKRDGLAYSRKNLREILAAFPDGVTAPPRVARLAGQTADEGRSAPAQPQVEVPPLDDLEVHVGRGLLQLVNPKGPRHKPFFDAIARLRRDLLQQYGIMMPGVRFRDDLALPPDAYRILVRGQAVETVVVDGVRLADAPDSYRVPWTLDDEVVRRLRTCNIEYAHELLPRQWVVRQVEWLAESLPDLARAAREEITLPVLHHVLQGLLRSGQSIANLALIVETLRGEMATGTRDVVRLIAWARMDLRRAGPGAAVPADAKSLRLFYYRLPAFGPVEDDIVPPPEPAQVASSLLAWVPEARRGTVTQQLLGRLGRRQQGELVEVMQHPPGRATLPLLDSVATMRQSPWLHPAILGQYVERELHRSPDLALHIVRKRWLTPRSPRLVAQKLCSHPDRWLVDAIYTRAYDCNLEYRFLTSEEKAAVVAALAPDTLGVALPGLPSVETDEYNRTQAWREFAGALATAQRKLGFPPGWQ